MRYQMTARTDRSDPGRYSPAYATGRELGVNWFRGLLEAVKGLTLCAKRVYPIGVKGLTLRTKRVYPFALKGLPLVRWGLGAGALGVG